MQLITFDSTDHLLSWRGVSDAIHQGHQLPKAKIGDLLLQEDPNSLLTRGAWIPGLGMAVKSMSIFPQNSALPSPLPSIHGGVLLFEDETGQLSTVVDGILVTKWKTAGDSVLGASLLANPNPKTHLMVGAGTVAPTVIEAYQEVFPSIDTFLIWNRTAKRAEELTANLSANAQVVTDLEEACARADIITTATMSKEPVLRGEWIKDGTHVDLIGAFKADMREADDALLQRSELFVDSFDTTIGHIGEIEIPLQSGVIKRSDILGDLYDLCKKEVGRSNPSAITVFKNGGGAHLDLMTSHYISNSVASKNT